MFLPGGCYHAPAQGTWGLCIWFGLADGNLSIIRLCFQTCFKGAFISCVKSLKEIYEFCNESRRLAFPQRKGNAEDYQVAVL